MGWSLSYLSLQFSPRLGVYRWQLFVPSENLYCKWSYQLFIFLKSPIQPQSSTETWHQLREILPGKPLQAHSSTMIALYHPPWSPQLTLLQCMLLDAVFLNQNIVTLTSHRKKNKNKKTTCINIITFIVHGQFLLGFDFRMYFLQVCHRMPNTFWACIHHSKPWHTFLLP